MKKERDCIDILKENLWAMASADQRQDIQDILSREIEIPPSGKYDIDQDPDYIDLDTLISEYMTEEDKKDIGL